MHANFLKLSVPVREKNSYYKLILDVVVCVEFYTRVFARILHVHNLLHAIYTHVNAGCNSRGLYRSYVQNLTNDYEKVPLLLLRLHVVSTFKIFLLQHVFDYS